MITGTQVKEGMENANISEVEHHRCGLCNYKTRYVRKGEELYFDSGCDCTHRYNLEPRSWDSAADWINMQSNTEIKTKLAQMFGLQLEAT